MATVNLLAKLSMATAGAAVVALSVAGTAQASSGFSGDYDPINWDLTNTNTNGFVNTTNAPASISVTGGNRGFLAFGGGQTAYTTTAVGSGEVSFDWSYNTNDIRGATSFFGLPLDPFGYLLNGVFTQLTSGSSSNQNGVSSFLVNEGDIFGFAVNTRDNLFGRATATISNFHAPQAVPEPASMIGLLGLGAFGVTSLRKRKQQATVKA
ncbi:MAG: PEP-CTERM sorting domain-containing protein [Nodularia sp. (in: Bacteria)]|nr:MAG: PEP-CTERM sorting domain-containing protein [Nodularia sp. (in: cyanobacteria)]